ncbi:cellulase family glycosylhydrolase [Fibrobacter sp. UWB10]|uniref:cellulase family glycosylhydrolase n=1 Tax=Fibrobacter sp. UWB10 TaxID=1896201 RepID=UPI0024031AC5|nr:cellulase family glycosylhydrolase [Fibrobacter sp. UWB10]SMP46067.1 cellulose synthase (UDP-forming) [Fibrobacter sp. UWB10]
MKQSDFHILQTIALLILAITISASAMVARPSINGKLHVQGTGLYDEAGTQVVLRGASTHGLTWFPQFVNNGLFKQLSTEWNTNLIRLAMYSDDYVHGDRQKNLEILRKGVQYAIDNDMYVMVDWHILTDNNPNENLAEAINFFNMMAKEYANVPNVIFEICNEPNGDCTWEDIKEYANIIIPVIRRHKPDALILIGTPNYDREIQFPAKDPINFENIMYTFHFYATSHKDEFRAKLREVVGQGTPIFVSESGLCEETGDGKIDFESVKTWYRLLDSLHLNYTIWSLSNKEEEASMIKDDSYATDSLTDKDLTLSGQFAKAIFQGTDIDKIELAYEPKSQFKLMARTAPYKVWALFAIPVFIILFITLLFHKFKKRFKTQKIKTYDDLLKYSPDKGALKFNSKPSKVILSDLFLFSSSFCTLIYLCWRVSCSIPFAYGWIAIIGSCILLVIEILGFCESMIHYSSMLKFREHPLPKIADEDYPDVDIFISTYNEPPELLRKTIIGCKYMEYPDKNKVHIYLCDDHRRPEMRKLAEELGVHYFDRPDNEGAKAGNLNKALERTHSPYVVTFDADMIPQRKFLLKTIPYFVDAERINESLPEEKRRPLGFIQTPQSFYTPDVFQHNLYAETKVPNEQDFFYDVIEAAKTSTNSVIYGGSNTIISRKALEAIGGFYTKSITEDFATGMLIESAGFVSLGLSEPLASGLAPSTFKEHVQQRTRWGRGVIATAKQLKFLRNRKLDLSQKLSYLSSVLYWFSPIKNLIYLISPLMFAVFCIPIFKCTLVDLALFWLPMHLLSMVALRITSQGKISSRWSGIYETSVMPFLLIPIIKETLGITLSTFKVTKKEKSNKRQTIDKRSLVPFVVLLALTVAGIIRMSYMLIALKYIGILAVLFWLLRNTYYLTMCIFLGMGRDSDGENVKVRAAEMITIQKEDGRQIDGITTKLLEHGVDIYTDELDVLYLGEPIELHISNSKYNLNVQGTVVSIHNSCNPDIPSVYTIEILDFHGQKDEYIQMLYDRKPTLPQRLRLGEGHIDNLWNNVAHRIASR